MTWPWRHVPRDTGGKEARERAEADLEQARKETPRYARLGKELRAIREDNHLAEAFLRVAGRDH